MPKQFLDPQGLSQFTENLEQSIVADKYSSLASYAVGNYCIYENLLYRCTTAIPSGESWNSSHWVQILIMGELTNLSQEATTTTSGLMSAADKVKLNGIESGAEVNVQSDWNAVSGDALILNKPVIPAAQVNSDWSASSGVAEILNKPTTISGYGITDAKIVSGTIILGSNSITPLTQHQSVTDNNPTLTWGSKSKVATIGSTEINVTMPANPDTNTTYTFANGTNGFTVTPSDGTAQTVTVTPDLQLEGTASGSIVSFNDGGDNIPVNKLLVAVTAQQAGSGTPSPSNPRAITGWTQAQITKTGKNLCPYLEQGQISQTTGEEVPSDTVRRSGFIRVEEGQTYAFSNLSNSSTQTNKRLRVFYYDRWKTYIDNETTPLYDTSVNATIPSGVGYIRFQASGTVLTETNAQVEKGSTPTFYEAYKGITTVIPFGDTYYVGVLDVTNGTLTVTHGYIEYDGSSDEVWYYSESSGGKKRVYIVVTNCKPSTSNIIANWLTYYGAGAGYPNVNTMQVNSNATPSLLIGVDSTISQASDWTTYLSTHTLQVVYELATPVVINFTKTQVSTLLNKNNIYADSGDISLEYFTQSAKNISDIANSSNKMDFSNPTGVGSLSLNRKDGTIIGDNSVALGLNCTASGERCLAEGSNTRALGNTSHTEGVHTIAKHRSQHVFGDYNIADPSSADTNAKGTYIEIVGKGTSDVNRSNARTLDWSGNETLAGDLTIKGNVSVGDAITLNTSGTASRRITDISVTRSKIVKFNGIKFFNATIKANAAVAGGTSILDVSTGFESASQQSLLVTASTGGTIQAYISSSTITTTNTSALVSGTVYYIIGWYT